MTGGKSTLIDFVANMSHSPTGKAPFRALLQSTSFCKRPNPVLSNREIVTCFAAK